MSGIFVRSTFRAVMLASFLILWIQCLHTRILPANGEGIELYSHHPIIIDGNSDLNPSNGVIFGSGTEEDPYEISTFEFDLKQGVGIRINGTSAHIMITICRFKGGFLNGTTGLHLSNSTNITIQHIVAYLLDTGILVENCTGIRMFYPAVMYTGNGIVLKDSSEIVLVTAESSRNDVNGIILERCNDVQIMDSIFNMNSPHLGADNGLLLKGSSDVWIWKCSFILNYGEGLAFLGSEGEPIVNITIEDCVIDSNVNGLWSEYVRDLRILNCKSTHNTYGMFLYDCNGAQISNCHIFKNTCGLLLELSEGCTLANCTFESNEEGARFVSSCDNTIRGNSFSNSSGYAVMIRDLGVSSAISSGNTLYQNIFLWNKGRTGQVLDEGENNSWDDGNKGNYWSDHQAPDSDRDGIIDISKNITMDGSVADRYPLVHQLFAPDGISRDQVGSNEDEGIGTGQIVFLLFILTFSIVLLAFAYRENMNNVRTR